MRLGKLKPVGAVEYDTWEKIYEHEISASDTEANLLATFQGAGGNTSGSADTDQALTFAGTAQIAGPKSVVFQDGAHISTNQYKFGTSSIYCDGNVDNFYLNSNEFKVGTSDFTIDLWIRPLNQTGTYNTFIQHGNALWNLYGSGTSTQITGNMAGSGNFYSQSYTFTTSVWYHIAIVRSSGTMRVFIKGTQLGSSFSHTDNYTNIPLYFGRWSGGTQYYKGYFDEVRFSKTARWTSNFTPETSIYDDDSDTVSLLHCEGENNGVSTQDAHTDGKINDTSLLLDGNSDYVTVPDSADWAFGTGDFTVDFWTKATLGSTGSAIDTGSSVTAGRFAITINSTGYIRVDTDSIELTSSSSISDDTWTHIAVVRSSGTVTIYIDGTSVGSVSLTDNFSEQKMRIGSSIDGNEITGYIDAVRVTKGEALWTSNFTPPTTIDDYVSTSAITIFGLEGDTDEQYMLDTNIVNSYSGTNAFGMRINGDSGNNYGYQYLLGSDSAITAGRNLGEYIGIGFCDAVDKSTSGKLLLHAKSGYVRTLLSSDSGTISGTTVTAIYSYGRSWNNTVDEITSINIFGVSGNMAVGSTISLYRRITS